MLVAVLLGLLAACVGTKAEGSSHAAIPAASKKVDQYSSAPTDFPVTAPLARPLPPGTRFALLQCATPVCALEGEILKGAAHSLGVKLQLVNGGASASSMQAAMNSIIELRPSAVLVPPVEPAAIRAQLDQLHSMGTPIVSAGMVGVGDYPFDANLLGDENHALVGQLLADWAMSQAGEGGKFVFYNNPELSFSAVIRTGFKKEVGSLCGSCSVRVTDVQIADIGTKAPDLVVSDLQRNPDTDVAVFATSETSTGLPAALKAAGIHIKTVGYGPSPGGLQDIKSGGITAGLAIDFGLAYWTQMDIAARLVSGEKIPTGEGAIGAMQFLTAHDIDFDPTRGWTAFPDFADRFTKLWKP
jgi:ribose transport system substrate-binding protein